MYLGTHRFHFSRALPTLSDSALVFKPLIAKSLFCVWVPGVLGLCRVGADTDQGRPGRSGNQLPQEVVAEEGLCMAVDVARPEVCLALDVN